MKKILIFLFLFVAFFISINNVEALTFDLVAPTGELQRGQEIKFTINIDTEGKSYSSTQIGMTHDTQYLEYVSTSVGNTFTTVSANQESEGRLIISGSSASGYSGSGTFAYVTFKIIAAAPGSTQLCVLFNPEVTPTQGPTSTPASTSGPAQPTSLPTSGDVGGISRGLTLGMVFLILAGGSFFIFRNL